MNWLSRFKRNKKSEEDELTEFMNLVFHLTTEHAEDYHWMSDPWRTAEEIHEAIHALDAVARGETWEAK